MATINKETLQSLITSLQEMYDETQVRFDNLQEQLDKSKDGDEKNELKKQQSDVKQRLDDLGGKLSGMRSVLKLTGDNADESHTDDVQLHSSRKILLPYIIHEQLNLFLFDDRFTREEKNDIVEMFNRIYSVYCELYNKPLVNLIDICKNSEKKEEYESLDMPHPWIVIEEKWGSMSDIQKRIWLYGTTNMNTLPRTLTQEGTEIPESVVNNDYGMVKEWTTTCLSVSQPQDGVDLKKEAKNSSNIEKSVTDFRKNIGDKLKVADIDTEAFKAKLSRICSDSTSGSVTGKGNIGMVKPVVNLLDDDVLKSAENAGILMKSVTANAFNRTSVGARTHGSSRHQADQSTTSGRTPNRLFISSAASSRLAIDQQTRATQQRSALPEDSQSSMGFFTHRTKSPIPVYVKSWVELCQKEFVTALAKGYLNFGVLIYSDIYWYLVTLDALFSRIVCFINMVHA